MPTKPLDRLMFVQGGLCFFCKQPLPKEQASVEHLMASANGGKNGDENCVACCKAVNTLFGSMSLKEKFQVVLNQKGQFKCPNGTGSTQKTPQAKPKVELKPSEAQKDKLNLALENLKQRGNSKPRSLKTLRSTISALFPKGISELELTALIQQLESTGKVIISDGKVSYAL